MGNLISKEFLTTVVVILITLIVVVAAVMLFSQELLPVIAGGIGALIVLFGTIVTNLFNNQFNKRTIEHNYKTLLLQITEKKIEEKRGLINKKLNEFYGPLQTYLNTSREIFRIFATNKPKGFRTLTYLLNPTQFYQSPSGEDIQINLDANDKVLLDEIFVIGEKIETLIIEKSGLVDVEALRVKYLPNKGFTDVTLEGNGLLAIAIVHLRLIRLAYKGVLQGNVERFESYVYPRELNGIIEKRIQELQSELEDLYKANI